MASRLETKDSLVSHDAFWPIKRVGYTQETVKANINDFVEAVCGHALHQDQSIDKNLSLPQVAETRTVAHSLRQTLERVCNHADVEDVTCVVELRHVDSVYVDLVRSVYSCEHFNAPRWCFRVSVFVCALDAMAFHDALGEVEPWMEGSLPPAKKDALRLQDHFVGSFVVMPRGGGIAGRTLVDPRWFCKYPSRIRLSDFAQTIRGKRVYVQAFPWRQQDGSALSCAETALLAIACYFSNEYPEYPITMPSKMLEMVRLSTDVRVIPSMGRGHGIVARVLRELGLGSRRYGRESFTSEVVPGETGEFGARLRSLAYTYVASGLPVAVNLQPTGRGLGHWVVLMGLSGLEGDFQDWDTSRMMAERVHGDGAEVEIIDACNLEYARPFIVSDDTGVPYESADWSKLSTFEDMEPAEIVVPTANRIVMGALSARVLAGELLRSKGLGMLACGRFSSDARLVLTQQLVSLRSYLRFRCATCEASVARAYESGAFPRYAWLFELIDLGMWSQARGSRMALGELLIDATSQGQTTAAGRALLVRYPGFLYLHEIDGASSVEDLGIDPKGLGEFVSFDGNLRYIMPE